MFLHLSDSTPAFNVLHFNTVETHNFPSLEGVDLSYSKELKETPDFGGSPRLRELYFTGCTNLVRVHPSIGLLKELVDLSFRNCCRLVILDLGS
ncbi:hypothetical protein PIB30_001918 [Stylosanthes scabra]|uniref:Uncharacterized protein n=1 Tax=Stylosanthes scabra TaxID=79078 RepID=A0ABU6X0H9_9FABA|nr:hypothetical protein [Stylosanthes scabra]